MIGHPYPGLRPFGRDEDTFFFGRETQVDDLLDRLQETHFLAVIGTSGSGKSSLVRAGLLPALDSGFMAGAGAAWTITELRPGDRPFARLATSLVRDTVWGHELSASDSVGPPVDQLIEDLEQHLRRGNLALNWRLGVDPLPAGTQLLVLVDQFEELFRYCRTDSAEAAAFVSLLLGAAGHPQVYVVMTMRSEFLGDCSQFPDLPEAINAGLFLTPRLNAEQIADAIQLPARLFGGEVAPELVRRLLADVKGESDQLPLLQHALMRLWDLDDGDQLLTLKGFGDLGGLRRALEDHAEEAFSELNAYQKRIGEILLRSLTECGTDGRDTRRPVSLGEVAQLAHVDPARIAEVVDVLRKPGRSFLMPPVGTPLDRDTVLDITHEALIRQWRRLHDLTVDEAERAELYQRLQAAALRWTEGKGALWVDPDLEYALQWRRNTQPGADWARRYGGDFDTAMDFLDAGRDQRERRRAEMDMRRRQSLRRARATALVAVLGLAVVAGVAAWGWLERQHALHIEQQRTRDLFDSALTHSALLARTEDYAKARRILAGTHELDQEIPASRRIARDLLARYAELLGGSADMIYVGPGSPLSQATISADGRWVAACGERGTLVLFDAASGELRHRLEGHDPGEQIRDCEFDPAGRWLASAGDDRRIILWSLPNAGATPGILHQWSAPNVVMSLAVSPDGGILATGGEDHAITLWEPTSAASLRTLEGHTAGISEVTGLVFDPRGERLASASYDGTARLWDLRSGSEIARFEAHRDNVKSVAFSPDGRYLATGGSDRQVILWDTQSRDAVRAFRGHANTVYGLAFAGRPGGPDAAPLLIAGGLDRTLRVWDRGSAATLRLLQGHDAAVNGIAVRDDKLYSASSDGTVRRWDLSLPRQRLLDTSGEPASVAVSPEGDLLAVGFADGGLGLYSLPGLSTIWRTANAHTEELQRLTFSADGSLLATAGFDGMARTWRVLPDGTLEPLHRLTGHSDAIHAVAFSPDARTLATAGYDGRIGLFDTVSGEGSFIASTGGQVLSVAFDPTGRLIFVANRDDGRIGVWDISRDPPVLSGDLEASRDLLMWAEPDAAGRQLAAVGRDYVVSILDASDGTPLHRLPRHENAVFKARFLPGGGQLATVGVDATVRLWDLATETELFALRLPTNQGQPTPLWDFDLRCTPANCWLAVPLTRGKLAVYDFGKAAVPAP